MVQEKKRQKTIVIGAGPVGALAALYAAQRDHDVEIYELRGGTFRDILIDFHTREKRFLKFSETFP